MNYNYKVVDERMNLTEVEKLLNGLIRYSLDIVQENSEKGYYNAIQVLNMAEKITSDYSDFEELVGMNFFFTTYVKILLVTKLNMLNG